MLCNTIITVISHSCYNEGMIDVDIDVRMSTITEYVDHNTICYLCIDQDQV